MAKLEIEGHTLGQKHEHCNRLIQNAIKSNKTVTTDDFSLENCDVINLLNIDIASNDKNVEYILKVLSSGDMLYVSRAITKSNWLINNENYAQIINPKHLETNIFPSMCTKAINKFMKHLRCHLNDETRAEEFYSYEKNPKEAVKWLPRCSLEFIKRNVSLHVQHIRTNLLRQLCEKSITVLEIYINSDEAKNKRNALQANMFLLRSNTDKYLDLVESLPYRQYPTFNSYTTSVIMKNNSNRIIDKFENYYDYIHIPTFIKCLGQENIKDFLFSQANRMSSNNLSRFFNLKRATLFVKSIPREIRYDFVKLVFLDKKHKCKEKDLILSEKETMAMNILYDISRNNFRYCKSIWYQFAPFNVTFEKVRDTIETVSSENEKMYLLGILLTSAHYNITHERMFLEYLRDKANVTEQRVKEQILNKLLSESNFLKYDSNTWTVLDDTFKSIDVYTESGKQQPNIIEAIIIYNILYGNKIPEVIEMNFNFNSLIKYHTKLNAKEKEMVFEYLYNFITNKLTKCNTTTETEFKKKLDTLEQILKLLKDFQRDLQRYPSVIDEIKGLVKIKTESSWTVNMETLFKIKNAWRKLFFEESLAIYPNESALYNALKHDPSVLDRNQGVVHNMVSNQKLKLKQFLHTIKIYWPNSFAKNITETYINKLSVLGDHKAATKGLSILLSRTPLQELIKNYAPREARVNFEKINEVELSVQQQIAKTMHYARPQPSPETILWFAKGDYLQYALPSLLSIFYNLNNISSRKYIPNLLDAPVSLQKHGIRLAVSKMELEDVLYMFADKWKNNKNATIRVVMFKTVFHLLCKEKDPKKIQTTWELLDNFIDNLTFTEDKAIYKQLFKVQNVPIAVRDAFYMKCYKFLYKLINSGNECEEFKHQFRTSLTAYSIKIVEQLDSNFVNEIIIEFIDKEFMKKDASHSTYISLISSYLLYVNCEKTQLERFEIIVLPILKQCFSLWNTENDGKFFVRYNLTALLNMFRCDVKECVFKGKIIPLKLFALIQKELEESLAVQENYTLLTKWKLTVLFIDAIDSKQSIECSEALCINDPIEFGYKCSVLLKEDCENYFPRIYLLFVTALKEMSEDCVSEAAYLDICRGLTRDQNFIQGYLTAIEFLPDIYLDNEDVDEEIQEILQELRTISEHPSSEVKIHYYSKFNEHHSIE